MQFDTMSGDFEETRDESGSDEGSCNDHDVGIETDDFVWEDALVWRSASWTKYPLKQIQVPNVLVWTWMRSEVQMRT